MPLPALAPSFALLLPAAMLLGAGNGSLDVAMNAHGVAVERRHESPILSSFHAAFSAGALIGAGGSALAAGAGVDVRWHLLTVAALSLVIGLVACRSLLPADADHAGEEAGPLLASGRRARCGRSARSASARCLRGGDRRLERGLRPGVARGLPRASRRSRFAAFTATMKTRPALGDRLTSAWARRRSSAAAACCPRRASAARC